MKSFLISVLVFVLGLANAYSQVIVDGPNTAMATQPRPVSVATYQQKTHWFSGGICYIVRQTNVPDLTTFITTSAQKVQMSVVKDCVTKAKKLRWKNMPAQAIPQMVESLREYKTKNISCNIVVPTGLPAMYQINFSDITLTDGDTEIAECMNGATNAKDKIQIQKTGMLHGDI